MSKVYCKNCKFNHFYFTQCEAYVYFGVRVNDYYSKKHLLRRKKYGLHTKSEKNEKNNCDLYIRKWWKFWVKD